LPKAFNFSEITENLYVSSFPHRENVEQIRALGVSLILSMYWIRPNGVFAKSPLTLKWMPVIDSPITPLPIGILKRGVELALPVIEGGGKVLVHCRWGIHRSVAMACCILISKGYSADDAMQLVKQKRAVANPYTGYVQARIRRFESVWKNHPYNG
jgi:protein-tyrosine phosphatase